MSKTFSSLEFDLLSQLYTVCVVEVNGRGFTLRIFALDEMLGTYVCLRH